MSDPAGKQEAGTTAATPAPGGVRAVRIPRELELSAASRLVSGGGSKVQAARRMVTAAAIHGIDLSLMWGTIERGADGRPLRVRQACLAVPGSGGTAMLVLSGPGTWPEVQEQAERVAAIEAACAFLADRQRSGRDLRLAQSLPEPGEAWAVRALTGAGFRHVGDLAYLRRAMTNLPAAGPALWPAGVSVRQVRDLKGDDRRLLIEALDRSYIDTLDCPDLCGLRQTADVLESHRATGMFDARLWWLVMLGDAPHGCMLFNNCPEHDSVELVYLGLSPQLRGKRLGGALLSMGLAALSGVEASSVTCAVDLRNSPAQRLYARFGFREFGRRVAMVRPLGGA